jgi:riboflavin-specific deaminase-like protein
MYVILSAAVSVDGFLDDASPQRLLLSGPADFDRVDEVRAGCDAILVGAETVRRDDPRLLVRSAERRQARLAAGRTEQPVKVTLTRNGDLPADARFFTTGDVPKLVYAPTPVAGPLATRLGGLATVVPAGAAVELPVLLADLAGRGIRRLLVEGGARVHGAFLAGGLADELHLAVAPFVVADPAAPRFPTYDTPGPPHRLRLAETRQLDDVVLLRYLRVGAR